MSSIKTIEIIKNVSQNMKVMWLGSFAPKGRSSWERLKGRVKTKESVDVEKILDEKQLYAAEEHI